MFLDNTYMAEDTDLFNEDFSLFKEEVDNQRLIDECEEITVNYNESVMSETFESMMMIQEAAHEMNVGLLIAEHNYYIENGHYFTEAEATEANKKDGKMAKAWESVKDFFKKIGEVLVKWWRQFSLKIKELWLGHYMKKAKKFQEAVRLKKTMRKDESNKFDSNKTDKKFDVYKADVIAKLTGMISKFTTANSTFNYDSAKSFKDPDSKEDRNKDFEFFYKDAKESTTIDTLSGGKVESQVEQRLKNLLDSANLLYKNVGNTVKALNEEIKKKNKFGDDAAKKDISSNSRTIRKAVSDLMYRGGKLLSMLNSAMSNTLSWGYKVLGNSKEPEEKTAE